MFITSIVTDLISNCFINYENIYFKNGDNCVMISDISNLHNIENFWNIIYERQIENTILLAKKGEMIPELYPTLDDSIEIADLVIEMESAEKINHNIQLLTFKLYNKVHINITFITK